MCFVCIQDVLCEGQELIVQVEKEECGNKGVVFIIFILFVGCYFVLMLNNLCGGGVLCWIEGDECQELCEMMVQLQILDGMSMIVCIVGIGCSVEELQWDLNYLL